MILRVILLFASKWVDLHTGIRAPDVEEMSNLEVYAGFALGAVLIFTVLFCLVFLLGTVITTVL